MQLFTGLQYLMIDIANSFGLDKKTWNERLEWFENNKNNLHGLMSQAEEPALFFAGVQAYEAVLEGKPIGYPISLDGTTSGIQILSVLTGDTSAASLCNVIPGSTDERKDGYTVIYKAMSQKLESTNQPVGSIERDNVKRAIMTSVYGSTAVPKEVFGEGIQLEVFFSTMRELAPAAWELNEAFLDIWDPNKLVNSWVLPDNFHVHVKVMDYEVNTVQFLNEPYDVIRKVNRPMEQGRSLGANCIHSVDSFIVRELTRRCDYNVDTLLRVLNALECKEPAAPNNAPERKMCTILWEHYRQSGYLSARILDYITHRSVDIVDRDVILDLINSMPAKPFKVLSVHDCFRVLPHYGNDLRKQYNLQLYLIAKSDMLSFLLSQIMNRSIKIYKMDNTLHTKILDTDYALS